jgi:alpha-beta hydrolase superfamily lysophospholipase
VLVLTSGASSFPREWEDAVSQHDIVLDVEQIRKWAHKLGGHVTLARVEGALHDVTLSAEPVRARVFDQIDRWLDAFVHVS